MVISLSSPPISFFSSSSSSSCKALNFRLTPFRPLYASSRSGPRSQSPRKTLKESRLRAAAKPTPETVAQSAIERISEKLRSLGYLDGSEAAAEDDHRPATGPGSAGEIFIPTPREIPACRVGHTIDSSWSTPEHLVPRPGSGVTINRFRHLWQREKAKEAADRRAARDAGTRPPPLVAEVTIPPEELKRLRGEGIRLQKRLKVGKAGITEGIVNGIHERWRKSELVKIKCEDLCWMNMKRTHEILERKTGGLVVWRSGSIIILYRGVGYKYPYFFEGNKKNEIVEASSSAVDSETTNKQEPNSTPMLSSESHDAPSCSLVVGVGSPKKVRVQLEGEHQLEEEADRLLDELGPRFTDWWGCDPLPVDADLLPAVVPGFRRPFRLLPFGIKPKLTDREMTILKRLARHLPYHFAIGRDRNHQGLAVSMIKLWEKCEVAKIAIKRGVQNTNSALISEELKELTGGTPLSRDKEFIVFYRGKDFLPSAVSVAIDKRRSFGRNKQKKIADENLLAEAITASEPKLSVVASSEEPKERAVQQENFGLERRLTSANLVLQRMENRLSQAIEKKEKAEKSLSKLEVSMEPRKVEANKEVISEEERYMLRKVGLGMRPFLLLGRRGVFDGIVENMHLHWKYRELIKIISKDHIIKNVESAARILEAESGGILVAIERVSKGHAIIMYRGKNYRRPVTLRPNTLLNKKEAMKRSLEAQRSESLKLHVLSISRKVNQIKSQMVKDDPSTDSAVVNECQTSSDVIATTECSEKENKDSAGFDEEFSDISNDTMQIVSTANELSHDSSQKSARLQHDRSMALNPHGEGSDAKDAAVSSPAVADSAIDEDKTDMKSYAEVAFRAAPLSNRERLVLSKQALKMKKRPVIAVGRSNVISGVAETIMAHFRKHPLAIVNIKGRAKGTSVQELIFELEQATGAVLVSREPNKVILYRGWGEGEAPAGVKKHDSEVSDVENMVSPQLMEAIRLECGMQTTA